MTELAKKIGDPLHVILDTFSTLTSQERDRLLDFADLPGTD